MRKYFVDDKQIYETDLLFDGYELKRKIEDMRLYRKADRAIIAKKDADGRLEILLNIVSPVKKEK